MATFPAHPLQVSAFCAALTLLSAGAFASPSGLNNIPTADTAPQRTFVLQTYSTVFGQPDPDFNIGFKTGLDLKVAKIEMGFDSHLVPNRGGPVTVQGKIAVPLGEHLPTVAIGAANVAFSDHDRTRAGDVFSYAVATEDLGWFRVHGGCAYVDSDALPFAGIDKTFQYHKSVPAAHDGKSVVDGKSVRDGKSGKEMLETKSIDLFTLRGDVIEQRDHSWLYSAGVLVPICKYFVFETWANFPDNGDSPSWTIKGNFVFTF